MTVRKWIWLLVGLSSAGLIAGSWAGWLPLGLTEVFGFVTGAVCVLLVVEQNIWTFPVGIANNVFFIVLFLTSRLYGDMALQFVYIGLALHGWWNWIYGGRNKTELHVTHIGVRESLILAAIGATSTIALTHYLRIINDSAPFLDALTTVLSLTAQYMLNKKRLENWFVWITADVIYIGLYAYKQLYLTSVLYAVFIGMCIAGLIAWRKSMQAETSAVPEPTPSGEVVP